MEKKRTSVFDSFGRWLDQIPSGWNHFLIGGSGYLLGAIAGLLVILFLVWIRLGEFIIKLIPESQGLIRLLAIPLTAGLLLGLGGAALGVVGGWAIDRILGLKRKGWLIFDHAVSFGVAVGFLLLLFLVLLGFVGIYNNFYDNQIEHLGLVFLIFGLIFGLVSGLMLAFLSVRIRYTWRIILASILGFSLGGFIVGVGLKFFNPTAGYSSNPTLAVIMLLLALLGMFFIGGGAMGWTYGRLALQAQKTGEPPESLLPATWQKITTAIIGVLIGTSVLGFLSQFSSFITINPADLPAQLVTHTAGVRFSLSQTLSGIDLSNIDTLNQFNAAAGPENDLHIVWANNQADTGGITYTDCRNGVCEKPVEMAGPQDSSCQIGDNDQAAYPAIAINSDGQVMAAWQLNPNTVAYSVWRLGEAPSSAAAGCIPGLKGPLAPGLSITSPAAGQFSLATSTRDGSIFVFQYLSQGWSPSPSFTAQGSQPVIASGSPGGLHIAYCDPSGKVTYQTQGTSPERLPGTCLSEPALAIDGNNEPHIAWYTNQLVDVNGKNRPESAIVESIRGEGGWSDPAVAALTEINSSPVMSSDKTGNIFLVYPDIAGDQNTLYYAHQDAYTCDPNSLNTIEQAGLNAILDGNFRPAGQVVPFCRNKYRAIFYTPNPEPAYSNLPPTLNGAFDQFANEASEARYEVLFTVMQYEPDTNPPNPGEPLADKIVSLYRSVKNNPEKYPRGMTVRILLGNYPSLSAFEWGSQIWAVLQDLHDAGLEKLVDEEIGWRVEVANFSGTYPHSHTKFLVIDGKNVSAAGFNYGYLHFSKDHPSGRGYDLLDLALSIDGPVAQDSIAAYDAMWQNANQVVCDTLAGEDWKSTCHEQKAVVSHVPEVLRSYLPPLGKDSAFSTLRDSNHLEADEFVASTLAAAQESIDMMQVNFSLEIYCMADLIFPGVCSIDDALPYMDSMLEAVEKNHVHVRVIMENANSNGLENRAAGRVFLDELKRRGLDQYVELRFYDGKVHAKSTLIDGKLLMIGSMNMHYSSFGPNGLAEYIVSTDSPQAIGEYQKLFETKWAQSVPFTEAEYATSP
jgi:phosphatidylserine/phosphatidylglycerophosphate/cardiolipin synthase-like enzyme